MRLYYKTIQLNYNIIYTYCIIYYGLSYKASFLTLSDLLFAVIEMVDAFFQLTPRLNSTYIYCD